MRLLRASLAKPWRATSRWPNQSAYSTADGGGFWSKLPIKFKLKPQERQFSTRRVQWTVHNTDKNPATSKKIGPVTVKLGKDSWGRQYQGWSTTTGNWQQLGWSMTDRHLLHIYTLAYGLGWWRIARWLSLQCHVDGQSCYEICDSCKKIRFIYIACLQNSNILTLKCSLDQEPANLLFVCLVFNGTFSTNRLYRAIDVWNIYCVGPSKTQNNISKPTEKNTQTISSTWALWK